MSTTIRLDASAVRALIQENPEFKFELQRAVIAETIRKSHQDYLDNSIGELISAAFARHKKDLVDVLRDDKSFTAALAAKFDTFIERVRSNWGNTPAKLTPELQALIDRHVTTAIQAAITDQVGRVDARVKQETDALLEKVIGRIGHVGGIVEHDWKVEALKQIREDVAATITGMLSK